MYEDREDKETGDMVPGMCAPQRSPASAHTPPHTTMRHAYRIAECVRHLAHSGNPHAQFEGRTGTDLET